MTAEDRAEVEKFMRRDLRTRLLTSTSGLVMVPASRPRNPYDVMKRTLTERTFAADD